MNALSWCPTADWKCPTVTSNSWTIVLSILKNVRLPKVGKGQMSDSEFLVGTTLNIWRMQILFILISHKSICVESLRYTIYTPSKLQSLVTVYHDGIHPSIQSVSHPSIQSASHHSYNPPMHACIHPSIQSISHSSSM